MWIIPKEGSSNPCTKKEIVDSLEWGTRLHYRKKYKIKYNLWSQGVNKLFKEISLMCMKWEKCQLLSPLIAPMKT